ncbi:MAG: hypothetical protein HQ518_30630 [Rhodopirellula sp.]|nr:hypothetical protein [Rhodopirellula sp.]
MQEYNPEIVKEFAIRALRLLQEGEFWSLLLASLLLLFVGQHLIGARFRLQKAAFAVGLTGFLTVIVAEFVETGFPQADSLPGLLFQALLGGGFSFSVATVVLPLSAILWDCSLGIPFRTLRRLGRKIISVVTSFFRGRREREERKLQCERQAVTDARRRDQESEAAKQQQLLREQQAGDDRRRQIARFECQLLFDQHHTELLELFPVAFLEGHFKQYMSDDVSPELVERRSQALQAMFRERLRRSGSTEARQFDSIGELVGWFDQKRDEIRTSFADPTDPDAERIIDTLNTQILQQRDQAIKEFLK